MRRRAAEVHGLRGSVERMSRGGTWAAGAREGGGPLGRGGAAAGRPAAGAPPRRTWRASAGAPSVTPQVSGSSAIEAAMGAGPEGGRGEAGRRCSAGGGAFPVYRPLRRRCHTVYRRATLG